MMLFTCLELMDLSLGSGEGNLYRYSAGCCFCPACCVDRYKNDAKASCFHRWLCLRLFAYLESGFVRGSVGGINPV